MARVCVVYATPGQVRTATLEVPAGTTVGQAVRASGVLPDSVSYASIYKSIGIFSNLVHEDTVVTDDDRIEIYRPLLADPKDARRRRERRRRARPASPLP